MEGTLVSYRRGRHVQTNNQMIIKVEGTDTKEKAAKLVGKIVSWKSSSGKEHKGKISAIHGNKGAMRVLFEKGLPGQALTQKVKIE